MQLFRDAIDECGFMDLGFIGSKLAWSKHVANDNSIWERLDKGLATNNWFLKFPGTLVHHLQCHLLDHSPLFISLSGLETLARKKIFGLKKCGYLILDVLRQLRPHGILVYMMWKMGQSFKKFRSVEGIWQDGTGMSLGMLGKNWKLKKNYCSKLRGRQWLVGQIAKLESWKLQ